MKYIFLILILGLHLLLLNQLTFTAWPEMLSYPYLLSHNFALYKDFVMPYPPLLPMVLAAVFKFSGFTPFALKFFTWGVLLLTDLLLFIILQKLIKNNLIVCLCLVLYIILQSVLDGNMLWFEIALLPFLLGTFLLLIKWLENPKLKYLFWVGILLGLAILIKQTAGVYLGIILGTLLLIKKFNWQNIQSLLLGFSLPAGVFLIYLLINNSLIDFWLWNIYYPLHDWSKFPGYTGVQIARRELFNTALLFLPLALIFLKTKLIKDKCFILTSAFLISSLIIVYPRLTFFHLQPALVFLIIILSLIINNLTKFKIIALTTISIIYLAIATVAYRSPKEEIRFYNSEEIFWAQFLNQNLKPTEKVYLLGLNSSLYAHSDRLPPKGWLDNFGWYFEIPGVQDEFIDDLKADPPKLILHKIPANGNWFDLSVYQPQKVVEYIKLNYTKIKQVGEIEIWQKK
ncbi:MAG: glycosyltransferase family 39 protein [Candidatus Daviesbacteria bacterium]|nr:glycosyltransferase family 39 protein [Candidatus Daviesbacteria bacterium]